MVQHRSMRGRPIDMGAISAANEGAIAVTGGGISLNARGDIIGPGGKIVKKAEQIQEEYGLTTGSKQQVSLADANRMKKFALKRQFLTPEEVQQQIQKMEQERAKAKKEAEKILTKAEMMSKDGPIIVDNTNGMGDELVEDTTPKPKSKRTIVDSEE